jgi:hypothetical protein
MGQLLAPTALEATDYQRASGEDDSIKSAPRG